jgi:hypothetical protein
MPVFSKEKKWARTCTVEKRFPCGFPIYQPIFLKKSVSLLQRGFWNLGTELETTWAPSHKGPHAGCSGGLCLTLFLFSKWTDRWGANSRKDLLPGSGKRPNGSSEKFPKICGCSWLSWQQTQQRERCRAWSSALAPAPTLIISPRRYWMACMAAVRVGIVFLFDQERPVVRSSTVCWYCNLKTTI